MAHSEGDGWEFDNPFTEPRSAEDRVFETLLQTREPTAAPAIADRADCDAKTARKYLEWFARLEIATRHGGEPVTYERNERYFEWRRVNDLATSHSRAELAEELGELSERIRSYRERYGVEHPGDVDALDPPRDVDSETAFADLADWESLVAERSLLERARRLQRDHGRTVEG